LIFLLPSVSAPRHRLPALPTVTLTYPLVQQQRVGVRESIASRWSMYSPGSLKVTIVRALPCSTSGVWSLKRTAPEPRYARQPSVSPQNPKCRDLRATGVRAPGRDGGRPSSVTQTSSGRGRDTVAVRIATMPRG